jgi:hypothetical protein
MIWTQGRVTCVTRWQCCSRCRSGFPAIGSYYDVMSTAKQQLLSVLQLLVCVSRLCHLVAVTARRYGNTVIPVAGTRPSGSRLAGWKSWLVPASVLPGCSCCWWSASVSLAMPIWQGPCLSCIDLQSISTHWAGVSCSESSCANLKDASSDLMLEI